MPLGVLGCTRATMGGGARARESVPEAGGPAEVGTHGCECVSNEEFLVAARHQRAATASLSFVHTARRYLRWTRGRRRARLSLRV